MPEQGSQALGRETHDQHTHNPDMRKGVSPPSLCPHLCLFLEFLSSSLPTLLPFPNPFYLPNFNQNAASYGKPTLISRFNVLSLPFESGQAEGRIGLLCLWVP